MEPSDVSLEEVRQLVAERQRYDGWLSALEQRRHGTPPRVFARVHDDYQARRAEVMGRLQVHVAMLERMSQGLTGQVEQLEERVTVLEEERIEAHLRAAVGEIDTPRWEALQQEMEGRLARLADERLALAGQLSEVGGLLARTRGEAPRGGVEPAWLATEPTPVPAPSPSPLPPVTQVPSPASMPPDVQHSLDDEVERALAALEVAPAPAVAEMAGPASGGAPPAGALAEVAVLEEVEPVIALSGEGPLPEAASGVAGSPVSSGAVPDAFDDMAFIRSIGEPPPPDARKTLRCGECGTFNLPTEWYCERCGGELAAE